MILHANVFHFASLGTRFHITKYPTLKYMRNGIVAKREYRGQRTVDAFTEFVRQQTEEVVKEYADLNELKDMDVSGKKPNMNLLCLLRVQEGGMNVFVM